MSNSKLTAEQKIERKELLALMVRDNGTILQNEYTGVTMVIMREFEGSKMLRVSVSFASEDEIKFRRKVGEYHALRRMYSTGEFVIMPEWAVSGMRFALV